MKSKSKVKYFLVSLIVFANISTAKDLGIMGNVWDVTEQDFRVRMYEDASKVDWGKINNDLEVNAKGFIDRQKKWGVPVATENKIKLVDISQELTEDLMGYEPQADGSFKQIVLFKKGYRFNPLERMSFYKWFAMFDGNVDAQVEWAKSLHKEMPGRFVFVASDGKLSELNENLDLPVYPVNEWLFVTAGVEKTPAIVGVSKLSATKLTVAEFADLSIEQVKKVMN